MEPLTHEQVLAVIGDFELERRQASVYIARLEARVAELEAELARRPEPVRSDS